jgi:hypothetical protein
MSTPRLISDTSMSDEREPAGRRRPSVLVKDPVDSERFILRPTTRWTRLLARMLASPLDRRLASGAQPESGRLMAIRASDLVARTSRAALAQNWNHLVQQASRAPTARTSRVPLCRDRIMAAEGDIRAMIDALSMPGATSACGVALASWLLTDAGGPLYNARSATDLGAVLRMVTAELDPAASRPFLW